MDAAARPQVTRRVLTSAAAWSVPVIAIGAPAPVFAASGAPTMAITGRRADPRRDEITITNTGPVTIPAGTTVTWTLKNTSPTTATLTYIAGSGMTYLGQPPSTIRSGEIVTITLTLTAPLAIKGTAYGAYWLSGGTYDSVVTVSFAGTPLAGMPPQSKCISFAGGALGAQCPTPSRPRGD